MLKNQEKILDYWYEYQPIRHCTSSQPYCDSHYLFCDKNIWRCKSRIQLGGNCSGYKGTEICYNSICIQVNIVFSV